MNAEDIVAHWRRGSVEDMEAAAILLQQKKCRHGMFFAHLALEKALKGHVAQSTGDHPPRIHKLTALAARTNLPLDDDQCQFFGVFDAYQLEGRYPEESAALDLEQYQRDFEKAQEVQTWLIRQL